MSTSENTASEDMVMGPQNHFDKLPNEIVLKIVEMVISSRDIKFTRECERQGHNDVKTPTTHHTDLAHRIAKISSRFKSIAANKSLWIGNVEVLAWKDHEAILKKVIYEFINSGTKDLNIIALHDHVITISGDAFLMVSEKCPELETLRLGLPMRSWPRFRAPWSSLRELTICIPHHTDGAMFSYSNCSAVEMHLDLPNLERFAISQCLPFLNFSRAESMVLPNMKNCSKLKHVELGLDGEYGLDCTFTFPGEIPFPPGLKTLTGGVEVTINWDLTLLKSYFEDCAINYPLGFCKPNQG